MTILICAVCGVVFLFGLALGCHLGYCVRDEEYAEAARNRWENLPQEGAE